jgi:hypothetical protein
VITFKLAPDAGEPYKVQATTRDILNWEKTTKGASFGQLADDMNIGAMYKIAYFAAKRTGHFTGTQQDFEASTDLEFDMDVEPDPTRPAL